MKLKRRTAKIEKVIMKSFDKRKDGSYRWPGENLFLKVSEETKFVLRGEECDSKGNVYAHPQNPKRNLERVIWKGGIEKRKEIKI